MKHLNSLTITTAVGILVTLGVGILAYISKPSPSLRAVVHSYPHYHLIDWRELDWLKKEELGKSSFFADTDVEKIGGVYEILLLNKGNTTAKDVQIFVPYDIGLMKSHNGFEQYVKGEQANLGDIKANEEMKVLYWTRYNNELSPWRNPDIQIFFDNGIVEFDIRYEISGMLRNIYNLYFQHYIFPVIAFLILSCVLILFIKIIFSFLYRIMQSNQSSDIANNKEEEVQ